MDITIRKAETVADAEAFSTIVQANSSAFTRALYTNGVTSEIRELAVARCQKGMSDPRNLFFLAETSSDPPRAIGCAKWTVFDEPCEPEPEPTVTIRPGINAELQQEFATALWRDRQRYCAGKRIMRLANLFTLPEAHRQGVGSKLLQEGLHVADEKGLPVYLESSPLAKPFYLRHGFEEVGRFTIDLGKYTEGGEPYAETLMLRKAMSPSKAEHVS